jgi:toxin secretion/phage lysis holin
VLVVLWAMRAMRYFDNPWFLAVGGIGGLFATLTGVPLLLAVLLGMMVIDVVVGLAVAWQNGEVSSRKAWEGGIRKVIILGIVLACWMIQIVMSVYAFEHIAPYFAGVPTNLPLAEFVSSYFVLYILISILENAVKAGIRLPDVLTGVLKIDTEKRRTEGQ